MMEKIKKISKYVVNALNMINALILGLAQVWGWTVDKISASIIVVAGIISLYLIGGKLFDLKEEKEEDLGDIGNELEDPEEFIIKSDSDMVETIEELPIEETNLNSEQGE